MHSMHQRTSSHTSCQKNHRSQYIFRRKSNPSDTSSRVGFAVDFIVGDNVGVRVGRNEGREVGFADGSSEDVGLGRTLSAVLGCVVCGLVLGTEIGVMAGIELGSDVPTRRLPSDPTTIPLPFPPKLKSITRAAVAPNKSNNVIAPTTIL